MAGVTRAEQLQAFRNVAAEVAAGRMGAAEARQAMREALAAQGYQARPGEEGSIKDLSSTRRLQVAIDTNVELARGWSQRQTSLQNYVRPAQELYRAGEAKKPRDWQSLWGQAAEAVGWEGVSPTRPFVALKTSPIWRALSRFDQPYPPFDFGSHMRVRSVTLAAARDAGLLSSEEEAAEAREKQRKEALSSLNENVECTPQVTERELREQLAGVLQGLAEWRGNTLVMTDPNGTRPYPPEEIGAIITAPLPAELKNRQAAAFREWTEKSQRFDPPTDKDSKAKQRERASLDEREDLERLFERIESRESDQPIIRSLSWDSLEDMLDFEKKVEDKGYYSPLPGRIADSFSTSPHNAEFYANKRKWQAQIICTRHHSAKDLRPLYDAVGVSKQTTHHPLRLEAEFVVMGGTKLHVRKKSVQRWEGGGRITYYVEEQ